MNRILSLLLLLVGATIAMSAQLPADIRFGNEATDTTRITQLIDACVQARINSPEERVAFFARQFIGVPYVAHTLEGEKEQLAVYTDSLDCTTFAETCLALAFTAGQQRHSWRDFVYNLMQMRYRNGVIDGYPSRLHYVADWAVDNIHRGNIQDACRFFPKVNYMIKNIDFMTTNRDKYPALADSANYARVRSTESGFRNHKFPYVRTNDLRQGPTKAAFRNGDVVALVCNIKGLDVTHMGVVVTDEAGVLHLLHASSSKGQVTLEEMPLDDFMRKNRQWIGLRVFRLAPEY